MTGCCSERAAYASLDLNLDRVVVSSSSISSSSSRSSSSRSSSSSSSGSSRSGNNRRSYIIYCMVNS